MTWKASGGRSLEMYNNTGRMGRKFEGIYLGYRRDGRKYILSLNRSKFRKAIEKVVGIWVSDSDYEVLSTGEMWTGKTKKYEVVIGRFGIYNVGSVILHDGRRWELNAERGWVIIYSFERALGKARSIIDAEYENLESMNANHLYDYLVFGYEECSILTLSDIEQLHKDFFGE